MRWAFEVSHAHQLTTLGQLAVMSKWNTLKDLIKTENNNYNNSNSESITRLDEIVMKGFIIFVIIIIHSWIIIIIILFDTQC